MTSPFDTRGPSQLGQLFKPRNDKPGKLPPIVLAGSPKWAAPKSPKGLK